MPVKAQSLAERATAKTEVDYGDLGTLEVTYYPGKFTMGFMKRLGQVSSSDNLDTIMAEFCEIVTDWDLLDPKGKPLPVTVETAMNQGLDVISDIVMAIGGNLRPKEVTSISSSGQ